MSAGGSPPKSDFVTPAESVEVSSVALKSYSIFEIHAIFKGKDHVAAIRYSELRTLHEAHVASGNPENVPPFPGKKRFGNRKDKFVEDRRLQLEKYLKGLLCTGALSAPRTAFCAALFGGNYQSFRSTDEGLTHESSSASADDDSKGHVAEKGKAKEEKVKDRGDTTASTGSSWRLSRVPLRLLVGDGMEPPIEQTAASVAVGLGMALMQAQSDHVRKSPSELLEEEDFNHVRKLRPKLAEESFELEDYCPLPFMRLRSYFGISTTDFIASICNVNPSGSGPGGGRSGSLFFRSSDRRYIMKTINQKEATVLRKSMQTYYNYVMAQPQTLLPRFLCLCKMRLPAPDRRTLIILVMNNIFDTPLPIHLQYDLKGSTFMRDAKEDEDDVLKDANFKSKVFLGPVKEAFLLQATMDVALLRSLGIMDYSLLVGIHFREKDAKVIAGDTSTGTSMWQAEEGGIYGRGEDGDVGNAVFFLGIIDVLQQYDLRKKLEHTYKTARGADPEQLSAVACDKYAARFLAYLESIVADDGQGVFEEYQQKATDLRVAEEALAKLRKSGADASGSSQEAREEEVVPDRDIAASKQASADNMNEDFREVDAMIASFVSFLNEMEADDGLPCPMCGEECSNAAGYEEHMAVCPGIPQPNRKPRPKKRMSAVAPDAVAPVAAPPVVVRVRLPDGTHAGVHITPGLRAYDVVAKLVGKLAIVVKLGLPKELARTSVPARLHYLAVAETADGPATAISDGVSVLDALSCAAFLCLRRRTGLSLEDAIAAAEREEHERRLENDRLKAVGHADVSAEKGRDDKEVAGPTKLESNENAVEASETDEKPAQ